MPRLAAMYRRVWRSAMKISTSSIENEVVLVEIEGDVDAHTARALDRTLNNLLAQDHFRLLLDVSHMHYISSAGLRTIMFAHREACQHGGEIRVYGLNAQARRLFEIIGLDECLHLSDSLEEAMAGW
jgi:anti-anti-sigma factor